MKRFIGITGKARSGKDTVADIILALAPDGARIPLAGAILDGLTGMFGPILMQLGKEDSIPGISRSRRFLMQTLGTEWGREVVGRDVWINELRRRAERSTADLIVVPDVRFENEAWFIRAHGGVVVHVRRPDAQSVRKHASENGIGVMEGDVVIDNDGSLADLERSVGRCIQLDRRGSRHLHFSVGGPPS